MKNIYFLLAFLTLTMFKMAHAQVRNLNPDPNGDPWIAGKIPDYTPEYIAKLDEIPNWNLHQCLLKPHYLLSLTIQRKNTCTRFFGNFIQVVALPHV